MNILPKERKKAVEKYHKINDKKRCIIGTALLNYSLQKELCINNAIDWTYGIYGKPSLNGYPEIYFNISHSGDWVVVSVGNCNIGIDVEKIRHDTRKLYKDVLSDNERVFVEQLDGLCADDYFIKQWTIKEAYTKLLGIGLNKYFPEIDIKYAQNKILLFDRKSRVDYYQVVQQKIGGEYWCSICAECDRNDISLLKVVSFKEIRSILL